MVFGNMGETSATGVAFTRNPSTGEKELYGEFLINAQGEDVVAGIRTPQDISEKARQASGSDKPSMERAMPEAYAELVRIYGILEKHYRDMQDMEVTVAKGTSWRSQTPTRSWDPPTPSSKRPTATCKTWSSRSRRANCGCSRPATASGPPGRR